MRQVVLDTETTGLESAEGHRVIEIGCVEVVGRRLTKRHFHVYLQPDREIDAGAIEVHGITNEFLADKPRFAEVAAEFMEFIRGAELVIHNAAFDVGFLNHELRRLGAEWGTIEAQCTVLDTLRLARDLHPGQKNNLDALCKRYGIDNARRVYHGALLDAEILADVYLAMTGGQTSLSLGGATSAAPGAARVAETIRRLAADRPPLKVIAADPAEWERHQARLKAIDKASGGKCLFLQMDTPALPTQ